MGMSASQSRFLLLTAQKSDVEYEVQQISQQRLTLSQKTEQISKKYAEATNARMLLFNGFNADGQKVSAQLTYNHIVADAPAGMGFRVVTAGTGKIVVAKYPEGITEAEKQNYFIDDKLNDAEGFEKNLRAGNYIIQMPATQTEENSAGDSFTNVSIDGSMFIEDAAKKDGLPAAEAEYKEETATVQNIDKRLELKAKQLDAKHKALETEIESVQKVIQKNVETSFKTFG